MLSKIHENCELHHQNLPNQPIGDAKNHHGVPLRMCFTGFGLVLGHITGTCWIGIIGKNPCAYVEIYYVLCTFQSHWCFGGVYFQQKTSYEVIIIIRQTIVKVGQVILNLLGINLMYYTTPSCPSSTRYPLHAQKLLLMACQLKWKINEHHNEIHQNINHTKI